MAEYIERTEELILSMRAGSRAISNTKKYHGTIYMSDVFSDDPKEIPYLKASEILYAASEEKPADVTPMRNGRWLDVQETDMYVPDLKLTATKTSETCSACKARIGFIGAKLYLFDSFCPSCGAKMDLEVPDNEAI